MKERRKDGDKKGAKRGAERLGLVVSRACQLQDCILLAHNTAKAFWPSEKNTDDLTQNLRTSLETLNVSWFSGALPG